MKIVRLFGVVPMLKGPVGELVPMPAGATITLSGMATPRFAKVHRAQAKARNDKAAVAAELNGFEHGRLPSRNSLPLLGRVAERSEDG